MSNLSFEVEFEKEGTGSIKGIPLSRIEENADALGESANRYNFIDAGTAYTIDDKNWHEYVEVGGHKWATMNVGAEKPEEAGDYFSWGEVIGQTPSSSSTFSPGFSWSNCPFAVGGKSKFNKYVPASKTSYLAEGFSGDPKTTLDLVDDAAYANWGGSWRMPTKEEFDALASKKLTFSSGYYFGDSHENKIFLPTAGCGYGTDLDGASSGGDYWSSSLDTDNPFNASYLFFFDGDAYTDFNYRYSGLSVRAIIDDGASAPAPESTADDFNVKEDDTSNWQ